MSNELLYGTILPPTTSINSGQIHKKQLPESMESNQKQSVWGGGEWELYLGKESGTGWISRLVD